MSCPICRLGYGHADWCSGVGTAITPPPPQFSIPQPQPMAPTPVVVQVGLSAHDIDRIARRVVEVLREEKAVAP